MLQPCKLFSKLNSFKSERDTDNKDTRKTNIIWAYFRLTGTYSHLSREVLGSFACFYFENANIDFDIYIDH